MTTTMDYGLARRMWHQLEPVHAVFWYAPEVFEEAARLGYDVQTRWPSYFAWRLAPRGAGGRGVAAAADRPGEPPGAAATAAPPPPPANAALPWPGEPHLMLWHAIN